MGCEVKKKLIYVILVCLLLGGFFVMRQRSLTVNLGYDIMGAGVVGLSSFLITQCALCYDGD